MVLLKDVKFQRTPRAEAAETTLRANKWDTEAWDVLLQVCVCVLACVCFLTPSLATRFVLRDNFWENFLGGTTQRNSATTNTIILDHSVTSLVLIVCSFRPLPLCITYFETCNIFATRICCSLVPLEGEMGVVFRHRAPPTRENNVRRSFCALGPLSCMF